MHRPALSFFLLAILTPLAIPADPAPITVAANDWPWWRGPQRNGVAAPNQNPPLKWSETENVIWKAVVPGRGHGSPTVVGNHVYLASADEKAQTQFVLCFDRATGRQLWRTEVHNGPLEKANNKSTSASSSVACDGQRLYINFLHKKAIHTTALDRDGKILWQTRVADYTLHQGFASSPEIYENLVLVSADNKSGKGVIAGLQRATGEVVWKVERPALPNYASPIVLKVHDREQLIVSGCNKVLSVEPRTGKKIWEIDGSTEETVTSTPTDGKHIFTSGGFPKNHVAAILADGSGKVVWEVKTKVYVPSFLCHEGHLYGVQDGGTAFCWKADTGKEVWSGRLAGQFSASPVQVGDRIYAIAENGRAFVFKASPEKFELLGESQLGTEAMASPAICGERIYLRVADQTPTGRQESLYCIGAK